MPAEPQASSQPPQASAQNATTTPGKGARPADLGKVPTKDDLLRGGYGPYRANNDLLSYRLRLRVDPVTESLRGTNVVRFKMLEDGSRIQLDLTPELTIDSVTMEGKALVVARVERAVFVDLPRTVRKGETVEVTVDYSGKPPHTGRFGCFSFDKDAKGRPWITTACEEEGASLWWPNKDQWRDEPQEGMEIDVAVPSGLMDVSNGRFVESKDLGDGYTEWRWHVHYPINNYDVALNIGAYEHFTLPPHGRTTLDFYALPEHIDGARRQFAQVPEMLDAYEHFFGEYPFVEDGFKLIDVPYAGMEHQSAVAYGNHFENGYYGRDWTGVGISPKFDFIIIHESGHEWFGNAVSAADRSDMWIHEGWTTYLECLYVEYRWNKADGQRYCNALKAKVKNERAIIPPRGTNAEPPQDQYFKGALMLNTLRSIVHDDAKWFADIHDFYQQFKYGTWMTEDVERWWSERTGMQLHPLFAEYLRHADIPVLQLRMNAAEHTVEYRFVAEEDDFAMPVELGAPQHWTRVTPNIRAWQSLPWQGTQADFHVNTDASYIGVEWR